jgi:hypothetical protein
MFQKKNRRTFIKECATITALAAAGQVHGSEKDESGSAFVCVTCGTQYPKSPKPPNACPICEDERQYIGINGQEWTTLEAMRATHKNVIKQEEPGLYSINTEPKFGIGQRAFLLQTPRGNILWDCVAFLDDATVKLVRELGGVAEIAVSHPHYYTTMVEWSHVFQSAPIHIHALDQKWIMRPDPCIHFWGGKSKNIFGGISLICTGGHFDGFQVLHWPAGAKGGGVLMAGDQPQVCMDPRQVSFMYSYPNYIPLNAPAIRRIVACLEPLQYDRLYGAFSFRGRGLVAPNAKAVVEKSADRYLRAIHG